MIFFIWSSTMSDESQQSKSTKPLARRIALGIGVAMHDIALGAAIGVLIGRKQKNKNAA